MEQSCCGPCRSDNSELNIVSKITIEFNERFKEFIKKLKIVLAVEISGLIFTDIHRLMPTQNIIREYIYKNQTYYVNWIQFELYSVFNSKF
jgi:hypothetical protein